MAYLKLRRVGSSAFCARVHFAVGGGLIDRVSSGVGFAARGCSGSAIEADSEGAPVPAWKYWKVMMDMERLKGKSAVEQVEAKAAIAMEQAKAERAKAEHWRWRCDSNAKDYLAAIGEARLEILQYRYHLQARGIPELFIKAQTRDAHLYCYRKSEEGHLSEDERRFYKDFSINWFPQARKEIWRIILEMPTMIGFRKDMQKVLSSEDLDLLVEKATAFHKEFHHFHHSGVRQREIVTFVWEHIWKGIRDQSVDPVHLEGFMQAMGKRINVHVLFVDERDVTEGADE